MLKQKAKKQSKEKKNYKKNTEILWVVFKMLKAISYFALGIK